MHCLVITAPVQMKDNKFIIVCFFQFFPFSFRPTLENFGRKFVIQVCMTSPSPRSVDNRCTDPSSRYLHTTFFMAQLTSGVTGCGISGNRKPDTVFHKIGEYIVCSVYFRVLVQE